MRAPSKGSEVWWRKSNRKWIRELQETAAPMGAGLGPLERAYWYELRLYGREGLLVCFLLHQMSFVVKLSRQFDKEAIEPPGPRG